MVHTSKAYKDMIYTQEGVRVFRIGDKITFADGTSQTLSLDDVNSYSINDATTEAGKFQVGAAIIKEYSVTLNNYEGKFDKCMFEGADISAKVGLQLADGAWEDLNMGSFRVVGATGAETIKITAYDNMLYFDRPYSESALSYPATITQIVSDACVCCEVEFDASSIQMGNYVVQERPDDKAITFRDVISFAAQIMGCYAKINQMGKLFFSWYDFSADAVLWGGIFDKDNPYSTGDDVDGGTFSPWNTGDVHNEDFSSMRDYHHLYDLMSKNVNVDDITITGVRVYAEKEGNGEPLMSQYGEDGYLIVIEDNPLIQSISDSEAVAQYVGAKLQYNTFRPMTVTARSDPSMEAGDSVIMSFSDRNPEIHTVITNTTFSIGGLQKINCSAESATEKNYTKYSAKTRILAKSKRDTEIKMNAYEMSVAQMNQLAANTMGFFASSVKQADGSMICYRHDKPQLSESKVVYKSGIDGFWVTQDYRGTDEATTAAGKWKAGFDSNGNAVLNMLSVIGINFSWAHGGTLTLGGAVNGNGLLVIQDASGKQIGYIGNDGVNFDKGIFKGTVQASEVLASVMKSNFMDNGYQYLSQIGGSYPISFRYKYSDSSSGGGGSGDDDMEDIPIGGGADGYMDLAHISMSVIGNPLDQTVGTGNTMLDIYSRGYVDLYTQDGSLLEIGGNNIYTDTPIECSSMNAENIVCENLAATSTKNRMVLTPYGEMFLFSEESPTPFFSDTGFSTIGEDGISVISIDYLFLETISDTAEYSVFLQKEGQGDLYVSSKERTFFTVCGTPNLKFTWEIKSIQKGFEANRMNRYEKTSIRTQDTAEKILMSEMNIERVEELLYE